MKNTGHVRNRWPICIPSMEDQAAYWLCLRVGCNVKHKTRRSAARHAPAWARRNAPSRQNRIDAGRL